MVRQSRVRRPEGARRQEVELVVLWRAGDRLAGQRLLRDHWTTLDAFLSRTVGYASDDVRQEVLLAVSKSIGRFQGRSSFRSYLFSVARHVIATHVRRQYRKGHRLDVRPAAVDELPAGETDYTYALDGRRIHSLLPELGPTDRQVLVLRYFEGASHREIADTLGCTELAARLRELRARKRLAARLGTHPQPGASRPVPATTSSSAACSSKIRRSRLR